MSAHDEEQGSLKTNDPQETIRLAPLPASSPAGPNEIPPAVALEWDDPLNTQNPYHWPLAKRVYHTIVPTVLSFEIVFATSITVPAIPALTSAFHTTRILSTLPLTLFLIGLALGPLLIAPLSEVLGRRPIYITTTFFLLVFTAGAGLAQTFPTLLVCRFLAGFLGSAAVATGAGTLADLWPAAHRASAAIFYILAPFLGPTLGPLAGAYTLHQRGGDWRWTQWVILLVGAPVFVGLLFTSETKKEQILQPLPGSLRGEAGDGRDGASGVLWHAAGIMVTALLRPTRMLFTELVVLSLTLYTAFAYAMVFSFFASASYVLPRYYGFNSREVGLGFISVLVGYVFATALFAASDRILYARAVRAANLKGGEQVSPKHRLYAALVGSVFLPAGLFWYAWAPGRTGWPAVVASGIFIGIGSFSLFISTLTYLVDAYQAGAAASAVAANGTLRYIFGAVFPLFTVQMYEKLGVHWAGSIFAFLSLGLLPIPWLIFKFGDRMISYK